MKPRMTCGIDDPDRAITVSTAHGLVNVLTMPGTDRILGVTIVGEHAGDLLAWYGLAMEHDLGLPRPASTLRESASPPTRHSACCAVWRNTMRGNWHEVPLRHAAALGVLCVAAGLWAHDAKANEPLAPIAAGPGERPQAPWAFAGLPAQKPPPTRYQVRDLDGRRVLHVEADRSYGNLVHPLVSRGRRVGWIDALRLEPAPRP